MSKSGKTIVVLALCGAATMGAWSLGSALFGDETEGAGAKHAVNQLWIERLPTDARDQINHFVLIRHPEGRVGAVGKSSQWRHHIEVFLWGLEGERLSVFLPQDQHKAQLRVKTWECAGEAPSPFQLCLELSGPRGSVTMYSRKDWVIDPKDQPESIAAMIEDTPALAGVLNDVAWPGVDAELDEVPAGATDWQDVDLLGAAYAE